MRKTLRLEPIGIEAWPAQDAARWRLAQKAGGIFDDSGALAGRIERDLKRLESRFGVWLAYLAQNGQEVVSGLDFLDERYLRPFLQLLESRLAPYPVLSFLSDL